MHRFIRVTVWTGDYASSAIGSGDGPVVIAFLTVYLPALLSLNRCARAIRDCSRRTHGSTFPAKMTEMKSGSLGEALLHGNRHIGGHHGNPDTWTQPGCHKQAHSSYGSQPGIYGHQRTNDLIITIYMGCGFISQLPDPGSQLQGKDA
jgi:hypothetical protein